MMIDPLHVHGPMICDRGTDHVVIEFLGCTAIELDRRDAIDLYVKLGCLLNKPRLLAYNGGTAPIPFHR